MSLITRCPRFWVKNSTLKDGEHMRRINLEDLINKAEQENRGSKFEVYLEGNLMGVMFTDGVEYIINKSGNRDWRWVHGKLEVD
jgi:frataxin-like iron-binding protein CyaY